MYVCVCVCACACRCACVCMYMIYTSMYVHTSCSFDDS